MEQKTFSPEELASYEKLFSSEELKRRITAEKDHQRADMFDDAESNRIDEDTLNGAIDSITDEDCKRVVIEDAIRHNDFGNHYDYDRDLVVPISEGNISALNTYSELLGIKIPSFLLRRYNLASVTHTCQRLWTPQA